MKTSASIILTYASRVQSADHYTMEPYVALLGKIPERTDSLAIGQLLKLAYH